MKTLHALFTAQAKKTPNCIAVEYNNVKLTYHDLDTYTNQLAREILLYESHTFVAICMDRSLEMVISIIATLKAGCAYVPIDPQYPTDRIKHILNEINAKIILKQSNIQCPLPLCAINVDHASFLHHSSEPLPPAIQKTDLAYVMYTSGTTGKPKGVLQTHVNVLELFNATRNIFHFHSDDVWTLFHSFVFDFSVWEMWGAWLHGGHLFIPSHHDIQNMTTFYSLCVQKKVTIFNQTPLAFQMFCEQISSQIASNFRYIILGGDALYTKHLTHWWPLTQSHSPILVNMYGITETTIHATFHIVTNSNTSPNISIGKPLPHLKAYVLDDQRRPVALDTIGELYIGGSSLSPGYLNQPTLTQTCFIDNPFQEKETIEKTHLYKTGDLVKLTKNGDILYVGRNDTQVKIRGYRIELGEITHALSNYEEITQCVTLIRQRDTLGASRFLVTYYVSPSEISTKILRNYLKKHLPNYMIPSFFVHVPKLPLTINGKINEKLLPTPTLMQNFSP